MAGEAKGWWQGTHRAVPPATTLARVRPLMAAMGITRIADVTGLDRIGLPVVTVVRPNARSLSVAQGKGLTRDAARASGLMESVEMWHAEHPALPVRHATAVELAPGLDPWTLPRPARSRWRPDLVIPWVPAVDLWSGEPASLPLELVTLDCRQPWPDGFGCFQLSTNGLASGNGPEEALLHALAELVERDAVTLWRQASPFVKPATRLDPASVGDPDLVALLAQLDRAGIACAIWEVTSDLGVPAFHCHVMEADLAADDGLGWSTGSGCHPDPVVALARAITEAVQARLTHIVGTRDDIGWRYYRPLDADRIRRHHRLLTRQRGTRRFDPGSGRRGASFADDLAWLRQRLASAGLDRAVYADLARRELGIAVVKLVVPGLEDGVEVPGWQPGPRARRAAGTAAASA